MGRACLPFVQQWCAHHVADAPDPGIASEADAGETRTFTCAPESSRSARNPPTTTSMVHAPLPAEPTTSRAPPRTTRNPTYTPAMPRTDTASALVHATRPAVFRALLDADARTAWLPPPGAHATMERFDATPGGGYRMILGFEVAGTGKSTSDTDVVEATFAEIVEDRRVVERVAFESDDPRFAGTMTMTWALSGTEERTIVTVRATDVPDGIDAAEHSRALSASLEQLADYVRRDGSRR